MRPPSQVCGQCQATVSDGDCIHWTGNGSRDDPYIPVPFIDEADTNLVQCSKAGFAAFLPTLLADPPACHLFSTVQQPIGYQAEQTLFFNESRYDTDSMHDKVQDSNRITFNTPGLYLVSLNIRWRRTDDDTFTGDLSCFIAFKGTTIIAHDAFAVPQGDTFAKQSIAVQVPVVAGDYVEAWAKQSVRDGDEKQNMWITVERFSPIFAAVFLRPIEGMDVLGIPESA